MLDNSFAVKLFMDNFFVYRFCNANAMKCIGKDINVSLRRGNV